MAPKQKRPSPLDDLPSDSEEEDQEPSSQQRHNHEEEEEEEQEASSDEQDDDDDDDDEDEEEEQQQNQPSRAVQPAYKSPPPQPANSHPKPSSSDSESDSATESDSDAPARTPKVKPLASTKPPKEQTPKVKPQPSSAMQAKTASSKRPAENNNGHLNDPKRAKKKVPEPEDAPSDEEDARKSSRDDSKKLFQRLFSEEDEIAILKGMVEFSSKTRGKDPFKCAEEFHDFMKRSKSLSVDASSNQLKQKIRRLKKKFENNAGRGKNGEGPSFSKPHEREAFELSKKVWGGGEGGANNGEVEKAKTNDEKAGKSTPKKESSNKSAEKPKAKPEAKAKPNSELQLQLADSKESGKADEKPETSLALSSMIRFDKVVGLWGLGEDFVRERLELIEASKREELEGKWRKLQDAELELYVKRAELYAEQAKLMLQANKSSKN